MDPVEEEIFPEHMDEDEEFSETSSTSTVAEGLINDQEEITDYLNTLSNAQKSRFEYLLEQTEIFSHFVLGDTANEQRNQNNPIKNTQSKRNKISYEFKTNPKFIKNGNMRSYQLEGLNWLISLHDNGLNGILADEMGLGKTLQAIGLLGYLKHNVTAKNRKDMRHIVIVPLTTVLNWYNEFTKWCPSLRVVCLPSTDPNNISKANRKIYIQNVIQSGNWDVIIVSYHMCLNEHSALMKFNYTYMIIDEGHKIKNEKAQISMIVRKYKSTNRLLLTGTPLQNNTHELWSLLNFLMPDVFKDMNDFDTWFNVDNCINNQSLTNRLHSILQPFLLRRLKTVVESELLPKKEIKIYVNLSKMQYELYRNILMDNVMELQPNGEYSKKRMVNILQHLRQCSNHPYFIPDKEQPPFAMKDLVKNSGKMIILDKLLPKLKAQGSRVIIFAHFLHMLAILEDYCIWRNYKYSSISGYTALKKRAETIDEFNSSNSDTFIFLISTRAGGEGINLATADTVILFDSDWNPHADLQAIDRAHRIGQTKQVYVYRLIAEHTIEERIQELADVKLRIDQIIIQEGKHTKNTAAASNREFKQTIKFCIDQMVEIKDFDKDEDIEVILKRAEEKTNKYNKKLDKIVLETAAKLPESSIDKTKLDNLLHGNEGNIDEENDTSDMEMSNSAVGVDDSMLTRSKLKGHIMNCKYVYDFQFFPNQVYQLYDELEKERQCIKYESRNYTDKQKNELTNYFRQGFCNWNLNMYSIFITELQTNFSLNINGYADRLTDVLKLPRNDIKAYVKTFFERYYELKNLDIEIVRKLFNELHYKCKLDMKLSITNYTKITARYWNITYKDQGNNNAFFRIRHDLHLLHLFFDDTYENDMEKIKTKLISTFATDWFLRLIQTDLLERRCYYLMICANVISRKRAATIPTSPPHMEKDEEEEEEEDENKNVKPKKKFRKK